MHRVMVVDDEAVITTQLEERLASMGYAVVGAASSGEEALEMAKQVEPDIILMDIVMPGTLDGIDAAKEVREKLDIPVIFLTAYADDRLVKKASHVGPFGYIVKPYQEREIRAAIEVAIYEKNIDRQLRASEEKYRNLVNTTKDLVFTVDVGGNILFANPSAKEFTGYEPEQTIGHNFAEYLHPDDVPGLLLCIQRLLSGEALESMKGLGQDAEYRMIKRDGEII